MFLVSVIIPTYNHEKYIEECIESVINQTYPYKQIIVVNDGSTDSTSELIKKYSEDIEVITKENGGLSAARNSGLQIARGKYICFLDSDDVFLPNKIEEQVKIFEKKPDVGLVHTGVIWINGIGELIREDSKINYTSRHDQIFQLVHRNYITCSSVMIRGELLKKTGLFNEKYTYAEDYDLWLRIALYGNIYAIPEIHLKYRWHDNNMTNKNRDKEHVKRLKIAAAQRFYDNNEFNQEHLIEFYNKINVPLEYRII